jgi:hypothetical protein
LPTSAWGTNYVAADGYKARNRGGGWPYVQIIASEDHTRVTISPTVAIWGGLNVAPTDAGVPQSYTLDKGQFLQFVQPDELAGSPIAADKPVSVWGGSNNAEIPVGRAAQDTLHQQLMPVSMLGSSYVAVRYRNRARVEEEEVPWRFVGAVDGTELTFDPDQPGAPTTLSKGQLFEYWAPGPFSVKSQNSDHPFYMSAHMTGGDVEGLGDPDFVNIIPPDEWLSSYLFLTDPTYGNTNLVFVRRKAQDGTFKDVNLDCAGILRGWTDIGEGTFQFTLYDLVIRTEGELPVPQGTCNNGVHTAKSDAPFALTIWGFDFDNSSYAFPAGMGTKAINSVHLDPVPR